MVLINRVSVAQTRHSGESLTDERIAQALVDGFSPHRCTVEFQDERRKVALRVCGPTGTEFTIEGKRLDLLRDANALAQYIQDVKKHLSQHRLRFYDQADLLSNDSGSLAKLPDDQIIDVYSDHDVRNWSRKFGCTQSVLRAAIRVLGPRVKDVEPYVKQRRQQ